MFLLERLLVAVLSVWLTATLAFFGLRVLPGDAIGANLAQSGANQEAISEARAELGLDASTIEQYGRFMLGLAQGSLGYSLTHSRPVADMIIERWQPTVVLALSSMAIAITAGVLFGVLGAGSGVVARLARMIVGFSLSTPIYWTGTLAIILFAVHLQWLPSGGTGGWRYLLLPVGVLGFHALGPVARVVQVNVREVRQAVFIQVARARGLPESLILHRHVMRVALLPVMSVIALQTGFLLSGAVITESIFARPGIGRLLLDAVVFQDYPVVQGVVILSAMVYILLNTLADISQRFLDPRLSR